MSGRACLSVYLMLLFIFLYACCDAGLVCSAIGLWYVLLNMENDNLSIKVF